MNVPLTFPALLLVAAMLAGCSDNARQRAAPEPIVDGDTVVLPQGSEMLGKLVSAPPLRSPARAIRLNGRLTWDEDRTVRVYTPFAGRVVRILAQPGERVRRGQALAVIASPDFGQAQTDARRAESDFFLAEKNLARLTELEQHGVAPRKDVQAAEADYGRAQAELARTRERLKLYGARGPGVDQSYALTSPIEGIVVEKNINPGQELRPDQMTANAPALFVITDPKHLWAVLDASERELAAVKIGEIVTILTPAYRDEDFSARVEAISDFLDPGTRTIRVRSAIDNSRRRLKAEMFVTGEFRGREVAQVQVPARAAFFQGGKHYVFVDEGASRFTRREVETGEEDNGTVEIRSGLTGSEKVVTEGTLMLQQILQPSRIQK